MPLPVPAMKRKRPSIPPSEAWCLFFVCPDGTWSAIGGHYQTPEEYLNEHGAGHLRGLEDRVYVVRARLPVHPYPEEAPVTAGPVRVLLDGARTDTVDGARTEGDLGFCAWCMDAGAPWCEDEQAYLHPGDCTYGYKPRSSGDCR